MGIKLDIQNGKLIKRFTAWQTAIIDVWLFSQEVDINSVVLQKEETDEAVWATSSLIKQIVEKGDFLSYDRIPYYR